MREHVKTGIDPDKEQRKRRSITLHTVSLIFKILVVYYELDLITACPISVCNATLQ